MYTIDDFILACESMKIYEIDYDIGTEGILQNISTGIKKVIKWIIDKLKWLWDKIRIKKKVKIRPKESEAVEEVIPLIDRIKDMLSRKRSGGVLATEEENHIIEQLQDCMFFRIMNPLDSKSGSYIADFYSKQAETADRDSRDKMIEVDIKQIKRLIVQLNAVVRLCTDKDKETINQLKSLTQFLNSILQREINESEVEGIKKRADKDGEETIVVEIINDVWCHITKTNRKNRAENRTYRVELSAKDYSDTFDEVYDAARFLDNDWKSGNNDFNAYKKARKAIFNHIPDIINEDMCTIGAFSYMPYKVSFVAFVGNPKPLNLRGTDYLYHISPVEGLTELRPSYQTSPDKPIHQMYPFPRVYVSALGTLTNFAPTKNMFSFGKYVYRFRASGYKIFADPEMPFDSACYVNSDSPIPVEQVDPNELGKLTQMKHKRNA